MNKKIRFGVVGTNFITDWVIAGAREEERFELAAVCSRTQERGAEFAAKHNIPHIHAEYGDEEAVYDFEGTGKTFGRE